jgi:hypothetical protein
MAQIATGVEQRGCESEGRPWTHLKLAPHGERRGIAGPSELIVDP